MVEKYLVLVLAVVVLVLVLELIREEKFTFKYAFGWIFVALLAIVFAVFDKLLSRIVHLLGFELTKDFVLFIFFAVFVFLSLLMTVFLCQQDKHNDTIAQKLGILEFELQELKKKMDKTKHDDRK